MHDEDSSSVPNGFVAPCGHSNPPRAHFCDVCGAALPMQCPRCQAINRRQAHFCSMCGSSLGDARRAPATPSVVPSEPPPASPPETEPDSAPSLELGSASSAAGPFSRSVMGSGRKPVAAGPDDVKRLEEMQRFLRQRRRSRQTRAWVGVASVTVLAALFGAGLVRAYIAGRSAAPPFIDAEAKAPTPVRAAGRVSAIAPDRPPVPTDPADTTVGPDRGEGSPSPGAPAGSAAGA